MANAQKKAPALAGAILTGYCLFFAVAHDFNVNAAIFCTAFGGLVACDWLGLTFAFGKDTISRYAFGYQEGFDGIGAAHGQLLVVGIGADRVGVASSDHDFDICAGEFRYQVFQFGFASRFECEFVEVEEGVCFESDFFRGGGGCYYRYGR